MAKEPKQEAPATKFETVSEQVATLAKELDTLTLKRIKTSGMCPKPLADRIHVIKTELLGLRRKQDELAKAKHIHIDPLPDISKMEMPALGKLITEYKIKRNTLRDHKEDTAVVDSILDKLDARRIELQKKR